MSYDQWLTTDPASLVPEPPLPGDPSWPRCTCGAWLKLEPERTGYQEDAELCDGKTGLAWGRETTCGKMHQHQPHTFVDSAWEIAYRTCARCRHENQEVFP